MKLYGFLLILLLFSLGLVYPQSTSNDQNDYSNSINIVEKKVQDFLNYSGKKVSTLNDEYLFYPKLLMIGNMNEGGYGYSTVPKEIALQMLFSISKGYKYSNSLYLDNNLLSSNTNINIIFCGFAKQNDIFVTLSNENKIAYYLFFETNSIWYLKGYYMPYKGKIILK
jgi:hypothetical protein